MSSTHTIQIYPETIQELAPVGLEISDEVRQRILSHVQHELQIVLVLLKEMNEGTKVTAGDVRLALSLRGFNLCI